MDELNCSWSDYVIKKERKKNLMPSVNALLKEVRTNKS